MASSAPKLHNQQLLITKERIRYVKGLISTIKL